MEWCYSPQQGRGIDIGSSVWYSTGMSEALSKTRVKRPPAKKAGPTETLQAVQAVLKEAPPPIIPPLPVLTTEEDTFALAVIECAGNVGAAYRMAFGTDALMASSKGQQLLANPLVQERIQGIMSKIQDSQLISLGAHLMELADIRDTAKATGQIKVALQAERSRGEAGGLYAKHHMAMAADSTTVQINIMTPEQLVAHANKKMGNVIDVTPKE